MNPRHLTQNGYHALTKSFIGKCRIRATNFLKRIRSNQNRVDCKAASVHRIVGSKPWVTRSSILPVVPLYRRF